MCVINSDSNLKHYKLEPLFGINSDKVQWRGGGRGRGEGRKEKEVEKEAEGRERRRKEFCLLHKRHFQV